MNVPIGTNLDHKGCFLVGPNDEWLRVPKEVFDAFQRFLTGDRPNGAINITFAHGGTAGTKIAIESKVFTTLK